MDESKSWEEAEKDTSIYCRNSIATGLEKGAYLPSPISNLAATSESTDTKPTSYRVCMCVLPIQEFTGII
jgi:hypothetical protein